MVFDGAVAAWQGDAALTAAVVKAHQDGFDQAQPPVIAMLTPVAHQLRYVVEAGSVPRVGQYCQACRLVQGDAGRERIEQQGDHLAAKQVGRVCLRVRTGRR